MKSPDFLEIAKRRFTSLEGAGTVISTERACRVDYIFVRNGKKKIEVGYETYSPPFCVVKTEDGGFERIDRESEFPAGRDLATGIWSAELFDAHEEEIGDYLDWLIPELKKQLES
ncbi:MAG: hypothetical protein QM760_13845 [Nibricoccus sp.]